MNLNKFKPLREAEKKVNDHLFLICSVITVIVMVMKLTEFFSRGSFYPEKMGFFYLGVLIIYSLHKEMLRWLGKRKVERQGEYFVYSWIIFAATLYVVNFFAKGYFSQTQEGFSLNTLNDISIISIEVLAIFILTRSLKILKIVLDKRKTG